VGYQNPGTLLVFKMAKFCLSSQECLLQLDTWTVHRSQEFRDWMKGKYPWITLEFVPGGCTGLWQPCDVGIQQLLKLSIKRSQLADIINETSLQLEKGASSDGVTFDCSLPYLHNRAVNWLEGVAIL
jgi:hypothetical protein